jgi:hypothetical protein
MWAEWWWAKWWWTGMVSATTTAACSAATRTTLEGALETAAAAEGHATTLFWCLLCIQGGRIDLRGVLGVIFDRRLLLLCFLVVFGRLLFLLGRGLLIGITTLVVLSAVSGEDGMILNVGHEIPEWVRGGVEVVDGRHDVRLSVCKSGLRVMGCDSNLKGESVNDGQRWRVSSHNGRSYTREALLAGKHQTYAAVETMRSPTSSARIRDTNRSVEAARRLYRQSPHATA